MAKNINNQSFGTPIVDKEGRPTTEFFTLLESLTALETISGRGAPEGIVFSRKKTYYWDELTNDIYFKTTNESINTGWILL